jgi:hypothetical protein
MHTVAEIRDKHNALLTPSLSLCGISIIRLTRRQSIIVHPNYNKDTK